MSEYTLPEPTTIVDLDLVEHEMYDDLDMRKAYQAGAASRDSEIEALRNVLDKVYAPVLILHPGDPSIQLLDGQWVYVQRTVPSFSAAIAAEGK